MLSKKRNATPQLSFYSTFEEQLSHGHPLYILANNIEWNVFEEAFKKHSADEGRPAKPIALMVALLMLKHLRTLSDESVVEQWMENVYYQYFSGERSYGCGVPCEASELVHFRHRIAEEGVELILKQSIRVNGDDAGDSQLSVDTTVQENNITFPTDDKLYKKIIHKCWGIAESQGLPLRQSYSRTLKKLSLEQRFRQHPKNQAKATRADRKVKTIAGRLVREVERNLPADSKYQSAIALFKRVLAQKRSDSGTIYCLDEPQVQCISKGKEHKNYEFGNKVSLVHTQNTGVIVGALGFRNEYDGHTLDKTPGANYSLNRQGTPNSNAGPGLQRQNPSRRHPHPNTQTLQRKNNQHVQTAKTQRKLPKKSRH